MASGGALDDIRRPGAVVETGTTIGTLHPAVAAKEVAAHAEGEAVRVVLAEELVGRHRCELRHRCAVPVVVHQALRLVQVRQMWQSEERGRLR